VSFENMAKLNVLARNCEVDDALQTHFEEKLESLERVWPKADEAVVRLSHERGRYAAEITLVSGGMLTRGEERAANLRQAFDAAIEKLEGQLRRYKKKATSQARRHDNRDDVAGTVINSSLPAAGIAPDGISTNPTSAVQTPPVDDGRSAADEGDAYDDSDEEVVRVKRFALKPMSVQEAALQMGLLGHSFFVFRDAQNNQVSVVYRRRDGGYGLIEPVAD
jgi:putative sigma-54 modulation protein